MKIQNYFQKLITRILAFGMIFSCFFSNVQALDISFLPSDDQFYLVDFSKDSEEEIASYSSYAEAYDAMEMRLDDYGNIGIVQNGVVYACEYGLVYIYSSDGCDVNVNYTEVNTNRAGYTNGCYGKDGLYVETSEDGMKVKFLLSGVLANTDFTDVTIVPYENVEVSNSCYKVENGILTHYIKSTMSANYYSTSISFGEAPDYLKENRTYESYDGHYFYEENNFEQMCDDVRNNSHKHAINEMEPYYDYYQFVSHRTLTSYNVDELENYLSSIGICASMDSYSDMENDSVDDTLSRSQFYGTMQAFFSYQYEYGANALMMISLAANESAWGRSSLAFTRNNLFGHAAYDSAVEENASRYLNPEKSILSHAKYYVSSSYCYPEWTHYRGGFFGNKSSGMNVMYASDPYWGEKAARYYRQIDEELGLQDFHSYTLGIRTYSSSTSVYSDSSFKHVAYQTPAGSDYSFVILGETKNAYKIQAEYTVKDGRYDFEDNIGYIQKNAVQVIVDGKQDDEDLSYVKVTFDGNGGIFEDGSNETTYSIPTGSIPACTTPVKDNEIFIGWDKEVEKTTKDVTYTANYRKVDSIEVSTLPQTEYPLNNRIDLENGILTIFYSDGKKGEVPLTTSMISGFDMKKEGNQDVVVTYAGCSTSYTISISDEYDSSSKDEELTNEISYLGDLYFTVEEMTDEQRNDVLELKEKLDAQGVPSLTFGNIRVLDTILKKAYGRNVLYTMNENNLNFGISGIAVATSLDHSLDKIWLLADTYSVQVSDGISEQTKQEFTKSSKVYGWNPIQDVTISIKKNFTDAELHSPVVMSIDVPEEYQSGYLLRVLYKEKNGDITKCEPKRTIGRICWLSEGDGEYEIVASSYASSYEDGDITETLTAQSSSKDFRVFGIMLILVLVLLMILLVLLLKHRKKRIRKKKNYD